MGRAIIYPFCITTDYIILYIRGACGNVQNAKKKCRLNDADIALAKRLGLTSQSLIKNIPSKNEPWNAPVSVWLYEMDAKQQKKTPQRQKRRSRQDTSEN